MQGKLKKPAHRKICKIALNMDRKNMNLKKTVLNSIHCSFKSINGRADCWIKAVLSPFPTVAALNGRGPALHVLRKSAGVILVAPVTRWPSVLLVFNGPDPGLFVSCNMQTVWLNEKLSHVPQDFFCIPLDIHIFKNQVMCLACYAYIS